MNATAATPPRPGAFFWLTATVLGLSLLAGARAADPDGKEPAENLPPEAEQLALTTSDGVELAAWYYPAPGEEPAVATVILLHDLGGSHETIEPLARALQAGGCSVVVPDLRGHGQSPMAKLERAAGDGPQADLLKTADFAAMTVTAGGRKRDQSAVRGDVESVRNWIKLKADDDKLDLDKLYLVGSGLGAAVAAGWTVADAAWPPIATGKQGGHVQGLVMVDPALVTKGFSISKPLAVEPLKSGLPIMIIAGGNDRDAAKVFDLIKRSRPTAWFDSRLFDTTERRNTSPAKDSEASLVFLKLGGRLSGDVLAAARSPDPQQPDPAKLILAFITATQSRPR